MKKHKKCFRNRDGKVPCCLKIEKGLYIWIHNIGKKCFYIGNTHCAKNQIFNVKDNFVMFECQ